MLGIEANAKCSFSFKNVLPIVMFMCYFCATIAFFFFESTTYIDIGNIYFGAVCMLANCTFLSSNVLKMSKMFDLIDKLENVIENSKLSFKEFIQTL